MSNTQLYPDPSLYADGLKIAWASNTTLTGTAGACRDSTNVMDIVVSNTITINAAVNGVNGLDTGSLAASTVYYLFAIADFSNFSVPGYLLSLSPTAPYMPQNYGALRYIQRVRTDGSSHILNFSSSGNGKTRTVQFATPLTVLSAGAATSFTAEDCLIGAGIGVVPVTFNYAFTPNSATDVASIRPTGSSAASLSCPIELKGAAAAAYKGQFTIVPEIASGVPKIDYLVTSGSDALALAVQSFQEYI